MFLVPRYMSPSSGGGGGGSHGHSHHTQGYGLHGSSTVAYSTSGEELTMLIHQTPKNSAKNKNNILKKLVRFDIKKHSRRNKFNDQTEAISENGVSRLGVSGSSAPPMHMYGHDAGQPRHECTNLGCERVTLNVSGMRFETRLGVLNNHPRTLLGNPQRRVAHYDSVRKEFFFDRHRPTFEAIFNYYQYGGKLKRPPTIPDDIFLTELEFYEIEKEVIDIYKRDEGYVSQTMELPENACKRCIWMLFEYPETSVLAFLVAIISVGLTITSIVLFCVETLPSFADSHCEIETSPNFGDPFFVMESVCTFWFTLELLVRFFVCPSKKMFLKDVKNLIDLAAVVPYYVTFINVVISWSCSGAKNSASLAFLRVIRLIRVFKLTKHSSGLQVLVLTFRASIEGLGLFLVALVVCILVFSSTIYYVEMGQKNSEIHSIPDAFWWAVITMCTVGYGDKVPKGTLGKIVGSVCALAGVLTLAIPVPIITENFNKFYSHKTGRGRH